eukprot:1301075-Rhodomonas_salina.1
MPHMSAVAVARPSTCCIHREPVRPVSFRIRRTRRSALALSADLRAACVIRLCTVITDSAATIHEMRYAQDMSAYALTWRSCGGST